MKDYLGNEIVAGMTIKIIRTKPIYGNISELKPKKNGKGYFKPRVIFKQPKYCWECVGEYEIEPKEGILFYAYVYPDSGIIYFNLEHIKFGMQDVDILTIKGISDTNPKPN